MLFNLADINYLENAFSKFSCFPALTLFPLKWIAPKENAVVIWSLFAGKNHVEIVLLNTLYFWATNDLVWPLSVSCNALNLSSMKVLFSFATCTSSFHCFNNENKKLNAFGKIWKVWNSFWFLLSSGWRVSEAWNVLWIIRLRDPNGLFLISEKYQLCLWAKEKERKWKFPA